MCNRYVSPEAGDMERYWHVGDRSRRFTLREAGVRVGLRLAASGRIEAAEQDPAREAYGEVRVDGLRGRLGRGVNQGVNRFAG